ncbi:MAG TPA: hypothetical protein VK419_11980, partial [Bryobacteraceae bacterium]|nr:hypothetical protein [Bryobacteraceae bacterium]
EKTVPPEWTGKILHARLEVGAWIVMGSDPPPGHYQTPAGMSLSLLLTDYEQAEKIFHALAENGAIRMPFQKPFWSKGYGQLIDQFQVPWMINVD